MGMREDFLRHRSEVAAGLVKGETVTDWGHAYAEADTIVSILSFEAAWKSSRVDLVVTLPGQEEAYYGSIAADDGISEQVMNADAVRKSLTDAGVTYK